MGSTPDLINGGNALTLAGGGLTIKGQGGSATCAQTLGTVTVSAGGGQILGNNNGGASTTITLGGLTTSAVGGSLLVGTGAANVTGLTITTATPNDANGIYGGRVVWFNGTANTGYDWATSSGGGPYTLAGLASGSYQSMAAGATSDTLNNSTGSLTLSGAHTHNTLKLTGGATLALGANLLSLTGGGLLSVGSGGSTISGTAGATRLTAGNGSGAYDLVIHQYNNSGLTISAVIGDGGGAASLTKSGPSTLSLTGANTYTGGTYINTGTLSFNPVAALGAAGSVSVTIGSGAILDGTGAVLNVPGSLTLNGGTFRVNFNGGGAGITGPGWTGPVALNANSTIDNQYNCVIAGNMTGLGGFTKSNTGTLALYGTNTYSGPTVINAGILLLGNTNSLYGGDTTKWTPANITVANNAVLKLIYGVNTNFSSLDQAGALLANLATVNNNGLLAGSTIALDFVNAPDNTGILSTAITDSTGPGGGAVGFQKLTQRALTLNAVNTYTGPTLVNGGPGSQAQYNWLKAGVAWAPGVGGAFGKNSAVTLGSSFCGLDLNGFDSQIGSLTGGGADGTQSPPRYGVKLGGNTLTVGGDNKSPAAFAGSIYGTGSLIKIGTGTLTLTGPNFYTGTTTISNGIINLGKAETTTPLAGPLGVPAAPNSIIMAGGMLQYSAANQVDYSSRFTTADNQAYNVDINNQSVSWATPLTSSGGSLALTNAGPSGSLTLSGANTYAGATTINGGRLIAGVASFPGVSGACGLNSAVTLANAAGAALDITGYNTQIGSLTGGGALGGNVTNTGALLTLGGDNTSPAAFAGVISGTGGGLTKVGTGTLTLNNTDTYTGSTTISGGTLALGASGAVPLTASIAVAAGATYDVSALGSYTLGSSTTLSASGTGLTTGAASFKVGATANSMNGRPMALSYTPTSVFGDTTHPALVVKNGNLDVSSVLITLINNGSPLSASTFTLATNVNGTFSGAPSLAGGTVGGNGVVSGRTAVISLSSDSKAINLTVTSVHIPVTVAIARHAGTVASSTYGDALSFDVTVTTATSGTVTLYDGGLAGKAIGSASLSGSTTCTVAAALNGLTAGTHNNIVARFGGDGSGHDPATSPALTPAQVVGPLGLTVTGAVGNDKLFDGTAAATLAGTLATVVTGDTSAEVSLVGTGTFGNGGAVGTGIGITSTSTLAGTKATSYSLTQPTGVTANVWGTAVWTNVGSGLNWSTAGNWTNSLVGTGGDVTADFSQIDITHDMTVHLDAPVTLGSLVFGDTATGSAGSWTMDNNGNALNVLTLAGTNGPCTITTKTVGGGKTVTISHELNLSTNVTCYVGAAGLTLAGPISGAGGLIKTNSGVLTLSGNNVNTFAGGATVTAGTLFLGSGANNLFGTGTVTVKSGATLNLNGNNGIPNAFSVDGATVANGNSFQANLNGPVTLVSTTTFDVQSTGHMGIGGDISGPGGLIKLGTSTMYLSGANSYTGSNSVKFGVLEFDKADAVGSAGLSIDAGAKVNLNYTGDHLIPVLVLGGTVYTSGNFGSTASGATSPNDTYFMGAGTVTVGLASQPPIPVLDPSTGYSLVGGFPQLTFSTALGYKYRLVYAADVATPMTAWLPVVNTGGTPATDLNGWVQASGTSMSLSDPTNTTGAAQRYYRIEAHTP